MELPRMSRALEIGAVAALICIACSTAEDGGGGPGTGGSAGAGGASLGGAAGAQAGGAAGSGGSPTGGSGGASGGAGGAAAGAGGAGGDCGQGAVTSPCLCGGLSVVSGYCCDGIAQEWACAPGPYLYVGLQGDDMTGDGSLAHPWRTLAHAVASVSSGDTIYLLPGTHDVSAQVFVPPGVSIVGAGASSVIASSVAAAPLGTLMLSSDAEGTEGNQSISYVKMDGLALTAWAAIMVVARSHVEIHHCTFADFSNAGIYFNGTTNIYTGPPAVYATGNSFHDNIVTNCAAYPSGDGQGNLMIGGQDGIEVYGNTITATARATKSNGYNIKFCGNGFNKAFKIQDNTLTRLIGEPDGSYYDFSIELWHTQGGAEISGNRMSGGIDFGGAITYVCLEKGGYTFGAWVHDNVIGYDAASVIPGTTGIYLEDNTNGALIERNTFLRVSNGIMFTPNPGETSQNHEIRYNVFQAIGYYGLRYMYGVNTGGSVAHLKVLNNVFSMAGGALVGIGIPTVGQTSDVDVSNNIIEGAAYAPILACGTQGQTLDILRIRNNLYSSNLVDAPVFDNLTPTNYSHSGDIVGDPLFVSPGQDFSLKNGSPAIDAGVDVGLTGDHEGNPIVGLPDIGAFERQ